MPKARLPEQLDWGAKFQIKRIAIRVGEVRDLDVAVLDDRVIENDSSFSNRLERSFERAADSQANGSARTDLVRLRH